MNDMTTARNAIIWVSLYLLLFVIVINTGTLFFLAPWLLLASPFLMIWMVYNVLKDTRQKYPDLGQNEWGYSDKDRDDLGLF